MKPNEPYNTYYIVERPPMSWRDKVLMVIAFVIPALVTVTVILAYVKYAQ